MKTLNGIIFLETKDIRKALQIGNKTCLELFNKKDFPGKKIGKSWLVMEEAFKDYHYSFCRTCWYSCHRICALESNTCGSS